MNNQLSTIFLCLLTFISNAQSGGLDTCFHNVENLMEQGKTDEALMSISNCRRNAPANKTISELYREVIWDLKDEYYHSNSDLELFVQFQSIVSSELKEFPQDSILVNLMTQVVVDKAIKYIILSSLDKGLVEIDVFLEKYPKQKELLEKIISKAAVESLEKRNIELASQEIDLLLNSKLVVTNPNVKFKNLFETYVKKNDLKSANYLYILAKKKFPDLSKNLNGIICEHITDLFSSAPSILTIQKLLKFEETFPDCTELKTIEKRHLVFVIKLTLKEGDFSTAGKAFQLAKINFRNDEDILILKKQWVSSDFEQNYQTTAVTSEQLNWNGDTSLCKAGTVSDYSHQMVEKRVNYFRRLAGLRDSCKINSNLNLFAQEAALIMASNNELSHFPDVNWKCYTDLGYQGAGDSNISLGEHSSDAITGQMEDEGENNFGVGHRRWILYPDLNEIGHGSTNFSQALMVSDYLNTEYDYKTNFVSWPPEHYVPSQLVFRRWSFTLKQASFYDSQITMENGNISVPITVEELDDGPGDNSIVWVPDLRGMDNSKPYLITITNVFLKGDFRKEKPITFKYWVEIIE